MSTNKITLLKKNKINISNYNLFVYDFDGVITNNFFYLSNKGIEFTQLFRSDELAIKNFKKKIKQVILSSSKNRTIKYFARKWGIESIIGVKDKSKIIKKYILSHSTDNICYFGNDDNDIEAAKLCKLVICPINAYPKFKKISNYYTSAKGGEGVLREFMEKIYM